MSELVDWPNAELAWTPQGHRMHVPVNLDERAWHLFVDGLRDALGDVGVRGRCYTPTPAFDGGPALLTIVDPELLEEVEPERLRRSIDRLAYEVSEKAVYETKRDAERETDWLQRLKVG